VALTLALLLSWQSWPRAHSEYAITAEKPVITKEALHPSQLAHVPPVASQIHAPADEEVRPSEKAVTVSPSPDKLGKLRVPSIRPACSDWGKQGDYMAALDCYEKKSTESGVSAELAHIESARIRWKVLVRPQEALLQLEKYEQRFTSGALMLEAVVLKAQLLEELGQNEASLAYLEKIMEKSPAHAAHLAPLGVSAAFRSGRCEVAERLSAKWGVALPRSDSPCKSPPSTQLEIADDSSMKSPD